MVKKLLVCPALANTCFGADDPAAQEMDPLVFFQVRRRAPNDLFYTLTSEWQRGSGAAGQRGSGAAAAPSATAG